MDPHRQQVCNEVCGWHDFKFWIKKEKLPNKLKHYVLNFLARHSSEFINERFSWTQDEDWLEMKEIIRDIIGPDPTEEDHDEAEEYMWSTDLEDTDSEEGSVHKDVQEKV